MTALLLITAALLVPQEKNEAEELFKKMEEKIEKAKSVQVKLRGTVDDMELSGALWLDEGGKVRIDLEGKSSRGSMTAAAISDGKKARLDSSDRPAPRRFDVPETFDRLIRTSAARAGFVSSFEFFEGGERVKADPETAFVAKAFKLGVKEIVGDRDCQAVDYMVSRRGKDASVTVWIDTGTFLPLKRVLKADTKTLTETYAAFKLDEKIDPAKFEFPKPEK